MLAVALLVLVCDGYDGYPNPYLPTIVRHPEDLHVTVGQSCKLSCLLARPLIEYGTYDVEWIGPNNRIIQFDENIQMYEDPNGGI